MKKSSSTLAVLLFASLVTGLPVFAAPTADLIEEKNKDIASDTSVAAGNTETSASNTVFTASDAVFVASNTVLATGQTVGIASETLGVSSDTIEVVDEVTAFDPFAADPFAGTSLKNLKKRINTAERLYSQSQQYANLALALTAADSDDRFIRRNCELLIRLTKQQPLSMFATMAIFPEFLGVAEELINKSIKTAIDAFAGDCNREPQRRAELLVALLNQLELTSRIATTLNVVTENIAKVTDDLALINVRRHVSTALAEFLKTANHELIEAISQQLKEMQGLLNQFKHHRSFCLEKLAYIQATNAGGRGVILASDLTDVLRSSRDFLIILNNYKTGVSDFAGKLTVLLQARNDELNKLVKRNSSKSARVNDFLNRYPSRDVADDKEPVFKADTELLTTFALLKKLTEKTSQEYAAKTPEAKKSSKTEAEDPGLAEILSSYVNGKPWEIDPENTYKPVIKKESPAKDLDKKAENLIQEPEFGSESDDKEINQADDELTIAPPK